MLKILFIGDIVGQPGRQVILDKLPYLRQNLGLDLVVANGENAAGGSGLTGSIAEALLACGIDALTLGDHVWDQRGFDAEIEQLPQVCRPANLPPSNPGQTFLIIERNGFRLAVFTLLGRQWMNLKGDCPFRTADRLLEQIRGRAEAVLVEVHAEATSEKVALGWYLDGRVAAVIGTHTHVPTADGTILPRGTAYLTDAGMTGPHAGVLGRETAPIVARFIDQMPRRFPVAEGDVRLRGCLVSVDPQTGLAVDLRLVEERA